MNLDAEIAALQRDQRHRMVLVVAAIIGIVASAMLGMAFALGGLDVTGAGGPRNPASLIFFIAPFAVSMAFGYAIYGILRWRARHA
jgi:hypothetical protein